MPKFVVKKIKIIHSELYKVFKKGETHDSKYFCLFQNQLS